MKRRLRCRVGLHRWALKQDSPDSPKYIGCLDCNEAQDPEFWRMMDGGGGYAG